MAVKVLKSSWNAAAGNRVLCCCFSKDGAQIAIGTGVGTLVLDSRTGKEIAKVCSDAEPVTYVAVRNDGRLVSGYRGSVRSWRLDTGALQAELDISDGAKQGAVCSALHPDASLLAAVSDTGRHIYILDYSNLNITSKLIIPTKCGGISKLLWLSRTAILGMSPDGLLVWRLSKTDTKPVLTLGQSIGLAVASASYETATLASASRDGVVYIWTVEEDESAVEHDEALSTELRSTLKEYKDQVQMMCWDRQGRYLATAQGHEATIWEVPKLLKARTLSTVCSGHKQGAQIINGIFQDDGPMLAIAANDGVILIFNSDKFQAGKHSKPVISIYEFSKETISCMDWLPGGRLVVGTESGKVGLFSLSPAPPQPLPRAPSQKDSVESPLYDSQASRSTPDVTSTLNQFTISPKKRPQPIDLPKTTTSNGVLNRQRSTPRGPGLIPKLSIQSLSENSSSLRSRDGNEIRNELRRDKEDRAQLGQLQPTLLSHKSLGDRNRSLADQQPLQQRSSSTTQISRSLLRSIENVKPRSQQQSANREPAGWGMGSPSPSLTPQQEMHMQMVGAMPMPVNPSMPGQMGPTYVMLPNQSMGPQPYPAHPGYPPMTPIPMMAPTHSPAPGMVEGSSMQPFPHPMMYMQVPHGVPNQAGGWPGMMPSGSWMGPYMMHPNHQSMQKHAHVFPVARTYSVPDGQMPTPWNTPSKGGGTSGGLSLSQDEGKMDKNAISLPYSVTEEWRAGMKDFQAKASKQDSLSPKGKSAKDDSAAKLSKEEQSSFSNVEMPIEEPEDGFDYAGEQANAGNNTIYVGNLAQAITESHLDQVFSKYGTITHSQVIRDKMTSASRGFGFVSFEDQRAVQQAIEEVNGRKLFGSFTSRSLKVSTSNRPAQGR